MKFSKPNLKIIASAITTLLVCSYILRQWNRGRKEKNRYRIRPDKFLDLLLDRLGFQDGSFVIRIVQIINRSTIRANPKPFHQTRHSFCTHKPQNFKCHFISIHQSVKYEKPMVTENSVRYSKGLSWN